MSANFLKDFYESVRNSMAYTMMYFILMSIAWILLAVLIVLYPQALVLIFATVFSVFALIGFYFAFMVGKYLMKLKQIKDKVTKLNF